MSGANPLVLALSIALFIVAAAATGGAGTTRDSAEPAPPLAEIPLAELVARLDAASAPGLTLWTDQHRESILYEIVRRGGDEAARLLRARLDRDAQRLEEARKAFEGAEVGSETWVGCGFAVDRLQWDLPVLTALRRVETRRDPLRVAVSMAPGAKWGTRNLPVLDVAIENVDVEGRSFWYTDGGNCRSGRLSRWRIDVRGADGRVLPIREPPWPCWDGGLSMRTLLPFGESWKTTLPISDYVDVREPGTYTVQVFYHDEVAIVDLRDDPRVESLIVFASEPFTIDVEKGPGVTVLLRPGDCERADLLIGEVREEDEVAIVLGPYDPSVHDCVSAQSPQAALLTMGWRAVPSLLEALRDERLSFDKRAWILALLYSITRERSLDPRALPGAIPRHVWCMPGGHGGGGGSGDAGAQRELIERWRLFEEDYLDVTTAE